MDSSVEVSVGSSVEVSVGSSVDVSVGSSVVSTDGLVGASVVSSEKSVGASVWFSTVVSSAIMVSLLGVSSVQATMVNTSASIRIAIQSNFFMLLFPFQFFYN